MVTSDSETTNKCGCCSLLRPSVVSLDCYREGVTSSLLLREEGLPTLSTGPLLSHASRLTLSVDQGQALCVLGLAGEGCFWLLSPYSMRGYLRVDLWHPGTPWMWSNGSRISACTLSSVQPVERSSVSLPGTLSVMSLPKDALCTHTSIYVTSLASMCQLA